MDWVFYVLVGIMAFVTSRRANAAADRKRHARYGPDRSK